MAYTAEHAYTLVEAAHQNARLAHGLLITGPRGCGKEALAEKIAWMLQGKHLGGTDLFGDAVIVPPPPLDEQACDNVQIIRPEKISRIISVDSIREVEHRLHMATARGTYKIVVLIDVDRMNPSSQNAFLKTLEEPPPNTVIILITAQPQALLPTTISRCTQLPLIGKTDYQADGGAELIATLNRVANDSFGTPWGALTLKAAFVEALDSRKKSIENAEDSLATAEEKHYRNTTDGTWLRERDEFHKAAARSAYLGERSRYFEILMAWMADALRCKVGSPCEDFPEVAKLIHKIAEKETVTSLLTRVEALENLRNTLETNAAEALAIESSFLQAFG